MINFDMKLHDNSASFHDHETGLHVLVDSCDNSEFNIRIGSVTESSPAGTITAGNDVELNAKLNDIYQRHTK